MTKPFDSKVDPDKLLDFALGQLPEDESIEVDRAIAESPELARRMDAELRLTEALKGRLARTPAPPGLETRIRAALREEAEASAAPGPIRAGFAWWRSALAGMAAGLVLGIGAMLLAGGGTSPSMLAANGLELLVVDDACDRMGKTLTEQRGCDDPSHLNWLKGEDGQRWQVAAVDDPSRQLVLSPDHRGHRLRVWGQLHKEAQMVHLERIEDLGLTASRSTTAIRASLTASRAAR